MKRVRKVEVRWLDSVSGSAAWVPLSQSVASIREMRHTTVGWLVRDKPDRITVCSSKQDVTDRVHGCITIPRAAITRIRKR
jgi:hypothetical protein